ncbi:hypothetical protein FJT64_027394 [Amphibalanus amphitrite]|uniref:Uncharacterized protein n=1 Tax=Amphibalanus amphitrite TaxID=1232801 RepID=A0A6A4WAQ0_AMPAM|nr:hypothetical protein FJT64_027394 [Amphibalanus amphitrite]
MRLPAAAAAGGRPDPSSDDSSCSPPSPPPPPPTPRRDLRTGWKKRHSERYYREQQQQQRIRASQEAPYPRFERRLEVDVRPSEEVGGRVAGEVPYDLSRRAEHQHMSPATDPSQEGAADQPLDLTLPKPAAQDENMNELLPADWQPQD